ncbi:MAG TPA: hypothetical protein VJJ72_02455 [Candidatus Paceibacterota bacterium]
MFKGLSKIVAKKKILYKGAEATSLAVEDLVYSFLSEKRNLQPFIQDILIEYNFRKNSLALKAKKKTVANELSFLQLPLQGFLKAQGVSLKQILIM